MVARVAAENLGRRRPLDRAMSAAARHLATVDVALLATLLVGGRGPSGRRRRGAAVRTALALGSSVAAVELIGWTVGRQRPFVGRPATDVLVAHPPHRSFPSKHAACAVTMATVALPDAPTIGRLMAGVAVAMAVSRVYVGLHYPSDVGAGAAVGLGIGLLARRRGR